ncbi:hypothetical protein ACROYT_G032344 [Oculina patagonica]
MYTNSFALCSLIALTICLTDVSCQRQKCLGTSGDYCPGSYKMSAVCRDGYCVCFSQDYDYETCLPDVHGCKIIVNADTALAKPQFNNQQRQTTYSCTPDSSSTQYEVHVLSVYQGSSHTRPPTAGDTHVNIVSRGKSNSPIILVLGSHEPVNWILNLSANDITISKVIVVAYYINESSVSGDTNQVQVVERRGTRNSLWSRGYGSDSGGGDTVGLLKQVYSVFGVVTSFTGTYRVDNWTLVLPSAKGSGLGNLSSSVTTQTPTPTLKRLRQKCKTFWNSSDCPGRYGKIKAVCKDGICVCSGQDYDYKTCLPDAYGCRIEVNTDKALAKPRHNNQQPKTTYSCTPEVSSTQYEIHVLSVYEVINRRPPKAGDAIVNIISQGRSDRPIILVLGCYEPVNWILNLPANITISKVILVAYYLDESSISGDVNQVQAVKRKSTRTSQWGVGHGNDAGGGNTVTLLRQVYNNFGAVTSFTGTYKADEWTLVLSSSQGPSISPFHATTASVGSSGNENPIPTQWIIALTVIAVVLVIVSFSVFFFRFRRQKRLKDAERSRAAVEAPQYNFTFDEIKGNSSLSRAETAHYGVVPILSPCPHYESVDHSTKEPAIYESGNSGIYEELDFGTLSSRQVYEIPGKRKDEVEYLDLVNDKSLPNPEKGQVDNNEYLEPVSVFKYLTTEKTKHNNNVNPDYLELVANADFSRDKTAPIVYEFPC